MRKALLKAIPDKKQQVQDFKKVLERRHCAQCLFFRFNSAIQAAKRLVREQQTLLHNHNEYENKKNEEFSDPNKKYTNVNYDTQVALDPPKNPHQLPAVMVINHSGRVTHNNALTHDAFFSFLRRQLQPSQRSLTTATIVTGRSRDSSTLMQKMSPAQAKVLYDHLDVSNDQIVTAVEFEKFLNQPDEQRQVHVGRRKQASEALTALRGMSTRRKPAPPGSSPLAPELTVVREHRDGDVRRVPAPDNGRRAYTEQPDAGSDLDSTCLRLAWGAPKRSGEVQFFTLELRDARDDHVWHTVCRDPHVSTESAKMGVVVCGLRSGSNYVFRVRAFNQHGASLYTMRTFCTRPATPLTPVVVSAAPQKLTFSWGPMGRLRRIFFQFSARIDAPVPLAANANGEGTLLTLLAYNPKVKAFLENSPCTKIALRKLGVPEKERPENNSAVTVWWCLTHSTAKALTWKQFGKMFSKKKKMKKRREDQVCYILERRGESNWERVCTTSKQTYTLAGLQPGERGMFRVMACITPGSGAESTSISKKKSKSKSTNATSKRKPLLSAPSDFVVACTRLLCPPLPVMLSGSQSVTSSTVQLLLDAGRTITPRLDTGVKYPGVASLTLTTKNNTYADWCREAGGFFHQEAAHGVDVMQIFDRFDKDKNHVLNFAELGVCLKQLDAPASQQDLEAALHFLDPDQTGDISLEQFQKWWQSRSIAYVLKRDAGVSGTELSSVKAFNRAMEDADKADKTLGKVLMTQTSNSAKPLPSMSIKSDHLTLDQHKALDKILSKERPPHMVAYHGTSNHPVLQGLSPNMLYRVQLTVQTNICRSLPSKAVPVMTAPEPVRDPGLVLVARGARWVRLAWYPNISGAHRYVVQMISDSAPSFAPQHETPKRQDTSFVTVWQGTDTTATIVGLTERRKYFFRVFACNAFGGLSTPTYMSKGIGIKSPRSIALQKTLSLPDECKGVATMAQVAFSKTNPTSTSLTVLHDRFSINAINDVIPGDEIFFCLIRRVKQGEVRMKIRTPTQHQPFLIDMGNIEWVCRVTAVVAGSKYSKRVRKGVNTRTNASLSLSEAMCTTQHGGRELDNRDRVLVLDIVSALKPIPATDQFVPKEFVREVQLARGCLYVHTDSQESRENSVCLLLEHG